MKKNNIIIGLLVIIVVVISAFLGIYFAKNKNTTKIIGLVAEINTATSYETKMITSYKEYTKILEQNNLNPTNKERLEERDFDKYNYIVDYILYDEELKVKDISLDIEDAGVSITYKVNKSVSGATRVIVYFIPVEREVLPFFTLRNRHFIYEQDKRMSL